MHAGVRQVPWRALELVGHTSCVQSSMQGPTPASTVEESSHPTFMTGPRSGSAYTFL